MQPEYRPPEIEAILTAFTGKSRTFVITNNLCATCDATDVVDRLADDLSRKEYTISGMCQACQDSVFGVDPFDISMDVE